MLPRLSALLSFCIAGFSSAVESPTLLKEIGRTSEYESSNPQSYTAVGAAGTSAVFFAWSATNTLTLHVTDGTPSGTTLLRSFSYPASPNSHPVGGTARLGDLVYFSLEAAGGYWEIWKTDGTVGGTTLVKSVDGRDSDGYYNGTPSELTAIASKVVFKAYTADAGTEPWVTDGTSAGTTRLADIFPGMLSGGKPNESYPESFRHCNGVVYFSADDGVHGKELWKTDGTPSGTAMLKDILPAGGSYPGGFTYSNGFTYFTTYGTDTYGDPPQIYETCEVWRTDGTAAGTIRLLAQSSEFNFGGFSPVGSQTVFVRAHKFSGNIGGTITETKGQFYITDGTPGGTTGYAGTPSNTLSPLSIIGQLSNGTIVYTARGDGLFPNYNYRLAYLSSGTLGEILYGNPLNSAIIGSSLYSVVSRPYQPATLFRYNPTLSPDDILTNLGFYSNAPQLQAAAGKLFANYYGPPTAPTGVEPYHIAANGAATLLKDIFQGATIYDSIDGINATTALHNLNGTLVFPAVGESGYEFWKSDGTSSGTTVLRDIVPGPGGHNPGFDPSLTTISAITRSGNRLFFVRVLPSPATTQELWVTDGTEAGTQLLVSREDGYLSTIRPHHNGVWWTEHNYATEENELWISDGTSSGTIPVKTISFWASGTEPVAQFANTTYVVSNDSINANLWEINPNPALTRIIFDFRQPGDYMAHCQSMVVMNGAIYFLFSRTDAVTYLQRIELWRMAPGGTPALVTAFPYGNFTTTGFSVAGNTKLWFSFTDGTTNPQTSSYNATLYQTDGTSSGTVAVSNFPFYPDSYQVIGDRLYFTGTHDDAGYELWTTDGTAPVRITGSTTPHPYLSLGTSPYGLARGGDGFLYFHASYIDNELVKRRIWRAKGTTVEAFGELPYPDANWGNIYPSSLTWANNRLYASAYQPDSARELYWWPAPAPSSPFAIWAQNNDLTGDDALPGADSDKDGVKNIVEFYTGTLPDNPSSSFQPDFSTINPAGTPIKIISIPRVPDTELTMTLESSIDLINWNTDVTIAPDGTHTYNPSFKRTIIQSRTGSSPEVLTFAVTPPTAYPKVFIRFRISE